jgi:murein DD-endopeptidase MepM/ murein hydrolase activator NlpD
MARWLVLACVLFAPFALAQLESELTRQLDAEIAQTQRIIEAQRAEQARLERELENLTGEIRAQVAERERISGQLATLRQEQAQLRAEITSLNAQLDATRSEIADQNAKLGELRLRVQGLLLNLDRQRAGRYARLLAESETFHQLEVKHYYLSLLTQQDVALIDELNRTVEALRLAQEQLSAQLRELDAKEAELAANEQQLESAQAELNRVIRELEASREGQNALRLEVIHSQNQLSQQLANLAARRQAEVERLRQEALELRRRAEAAVLERERSRLQREAEETEARAEALATPLPPPREANFVYPLANPSLAFPYGQQGTFVGLQAPQAGAEVRAAMSGVVPALYYTANSGYVVMILHSDNVVTAYENLQAPTVRVGDRVSQGQVIGRLGGSSLIPANILYFHVGVLDASGRPRYVDPAQHLGF